MTSQLEIKKHLTEIEKAELLQACIKALTPEGVMLLRRLMWELDELKYFIGGKR